MRAWVGIHRLTNNEITCWINVIFPSRPVFADRNRIYCQLWVKIGQLWVVDTVIFAITFTSGCTWLNTLLSFVLSHHTHWWVSVITLSNKAIIDGKYLALPLSSAWQRSPHFFRDFISLLARVFIFLIDRATQEVPIQNICLSVTSFFRYTPLDC